VFWVLGPIVGLGAIVLGVAARRNGGGREATIAIVLAAVPVLWFAASHDRRSTRLRQRPP
jgi:hypothetical protein